MLYFITQITVWQLLKLIITLCDKMLSKGCNLAVLCYNYSGAIARPQRQQQQGTFLETYKQLNHTYTFKIIFKYVICIQLYTFSPSIPS